MIVQNRKEKIKTFIRDIQNKWDRKKKKFVNLHQVIFDPQILILAYADIFKSKNVSTQNKNVKNLTKIDSTRIKNLSKHLFKESWNVNGVKKIFFLIKETDETKVLNILSFYDKVIVNAMRIVLSFIYENHKELNFLPMSRYFSSDII